MSTPLLLFTYISCIRVVHVVNYIFSVLCCDVCYDFHVKTMLGLSLHPFVLSEVYVLFMLIVFIYTSWCPTRFPFQMMFVSLNSNTTGVTTGVGTANRSRAPAFIFIMTFSKL